MNPRGAATASPRSVCFFGTYARDYTVTRLLLQACQAAGVQVTECHRPLWEQTRHKDARYFRSASTLRLVTRYAREAVTLARMRRALPRPDAYLIGFNGQLDTVLLRWLLRRTATPTLFAPLVTLRETLVDDRRVFSAGSPRSRAAAWLDRLSLRSATRVIIDAEAHRRYLVEHFGLRREQVAVWHLGADPAAFVRVPPPAPRLPVRVLFYGSYLPLHGVTTILAAAAALRARPHIEFVLLGDGPERAAAEARARAQGLANVTFRGWVPYASLPHEIAAADICLGIFGTTAKAAMVIPNKVYQAAAVGRAIITADTPAVREVFAHAESVWLSPSGDGVALAEAIRMLAEDPARRQEIAAAAAELMHDRFAPRQQGERLMRIVDEACAA